MPKKPISPATEKFRSLLTAGVSQVAGDLLRHIAPIYAVDDYGKPHLEGTGTLISVGEKYYMVTAAHVIDAFENSELYTFRRGDAQYSIKLNPYLLTTKAPNGNRNEDRIDIGIIELVGEQIAYFGIDAFCPIEAFDLSLQSQTNAKYIVAGYPCKKNKVLKKEHFETSSTAMVFVSELATPQNFDRAKLDRGRHFLIRFNKRRVTIDGAREMAPDPYGLSGGSLWKMDFNISPEPLKLAGILIEWNKPAGGFVAVQIRVIVQILFEALPSLFAETLLKSSGRNPL